MGKTGSVAGDLASYQSLIWAMNFPMKFANLRDRDDFRFKMAMSRLGPIAMTRMTIAENQGRIEGGPRRPGSGAIMLNYTERGNVFLEGRRRATTAPGNLTLISGNRPVEMRQHGSGQALVLSIPSPLLSLYYSDIEDRCLVPIDSSHGVAAILRECVLTAWRQRNAIGETMERGLADVLIRLIGQVFRDDRQMLDFASKSVQLHFLRVKDFVETNLHNFDLSPDSVAHKLGISKSYLYAVMHSGNTTLGEYVLDRRMRRARELLSDCDGGWRSISEIAYQVGFQDPSYFGKCYRKAFGMTPKQHRLAAHGLAGETG